MYIAFCRAYKKSDSAGENPARVSRPTTLRSAHSKWRDRSVTSLKSVDLCVKERGARGADSSVARKLLIKLVLTYDERSNSNTDKRAYQRELSEQLGQHGTHAKRLKHGDIGMFRP